MSDYDPRERTGWPGYDAFVVRPATPHVRQSSSLAVRQPFQLAGTFRVYFNRHQAAPLVWCVAVMDAAAPMLEIACAELSIDAPMTTIYAPKAAPDDDDGKPSAWLEVTGVLIVDDRSVRIARAA